MKNPKKHGHAGKTRPKKSREPAVGRGEPPSLPSEQWLSESTAFAAAQQADDSPSPSASNTGGPHKDPCTGTPPASVSFKEKPVLNEPREKPGGSSIWSEPPNFEFGAFCDGKAKVWTCRITAATGQQQMEIGPPVLPLNQAAIDSATCAQLKDMLKLVNHNITDPSAGGGYMPPGWILAHERIHVRQSSEDVLKRYEALKAEIEAISIDCAEYETADEAKDAMRTAIRTAANNFRIKWRADEKKNQAHLPGAKFLALNQRIFGYWKNQIEKKLQEKGCE